MKYSWNAKTPMTSPDMVAKPIKWNPMSEDWKNEWRQCSCTTRTLPRLGSQTK